MPLSKARDAERKRQERAKIRLDKGLLPSAGKRPIQPTDRLVHYRDGLEPPDIDADGNVIPDYE